MRPAVGRLARPRPRSKPDDTSDHQCTTAVCRGEVAVLCRPPQTHSAPGGPAAAQTLNADATSRDRTRCGETLYSHTAEELTVGLVTFAV